MAQSKRRSNRAQPSQKRERNTSRMPGEAKPQQQSSNDRQPHEEPNRRNVEAPAKQEVDRNPSVNQPMEDEPSSSRRPGGSGDVDR